MIVDFHTHIFPDKIAERAIRKLEITCHQKAEFNGSAAGLCSCMEEAGIDLSVVLPVVTDVHQFDSILRFAVQINEANENKSGKRLLSLAGIHPGDEDYKDHLVQIRREGFAGVKVHPNYQGMNFSDLRYKRLLYAASEQGLFVITHAGFDPLTPDEDFCTPDMILEVLRDVSPEKLVLAHMGNLRNYEEAEEKLCGQNVYLDTACALGDIGEERFLRFVRRHGSERILFASDCPWASQKAYVEFIEKLPMLESDRENIFFKNAQTLLKI